jgi:hypothetical protein
MIHPMFFHRFRHGLLNRGEQALVGAIGGFVIGSLLGCFIDLSSPRPRAPGQLSILAAALSCGSILAIVGGLFCALAEVRAVPRKPQEEPAVESWQPRRAYIMAEVYPKEHATREQLLALGKELEAWRSSQPSVTAIGGLEELLSGRYPPSDGPTPYIEDPEGDVLMPFGRLTSDGLRTEFRRGRAVDPWLYCPAIIWATEEITSNEVIESLLRSIPPALIWNITPGFPKN